MYLVDGVGKIDGRKLPERIRVAYDLISQVYFSTVATPFQLRRDFEIRDNESAQILLNQLIVLAVAADPEPEKIVVFPPR